MSSFFRWVPPLVVGVCGLSALVSGAAQGASVDVNSPTPYVGIGINQLSYFDGSHAMADLVRHSQFRSHDWGEDVGADTLGAPTRDFLMIFSSLRVAAGTYKLSFKGQAQVSVSASADNGGSAQPSIQHQRYDAASNTTTADVVLPVHTRGNAWLAFSQTRRTRASTSADGLTDLHLWRPGYPTNGSVHFTQAYIEAMKKFHLIRGMDFVSANNNPSVQWSERTPMAWQGFVRSKGQPWELLIALANETGNDVWLNVPVKADDDYIRKLAQLVRYGSDGVNPYPHTQAKPVYPPLKPGLKVYVEYGNELWNAGPGFLGFGWALGLANTHKANPTHPIAYDGATAGDQYLALRRWIAYRSATLSQTFRSVFGDAAMMSTVRPILASQVGNANVYLSEGLKWAEGFYGQERRTAPLNPVARRIPELWWGAGGAAYYDAQTPPTDTSEKTMAAYFASLPNAEFASHTATDAVWARGFGLVSVAYEGGPGPGGHATSGTAAGSPQLASTYNADPRMKARMQAAHQIYQANGGQLLAYYVYNGAPPWEFVDSARPNTASDTRTVKLQAIDAIRQQPKTAETLGTLVPASIWLPAGRRAGIELDGGDSWRYDAQALRFVTGPVARGAAFSSSALIPVRAAQAGRFQFTLTTYPEADTQVELLINGQRAGVWALTGSCGGICNGPPVVSTAVSAPLPAGLSVVRLRPLSGSVWIKSLQVMP